MPSKIISVTISCSEQKLYVIYDLIHFRGDHIVPNFEEIWPSKKGGKSGRPMRGLEYYLDAMENGPQLSGTERFSKFQIEIYNNVY